jgi:hypothetical protein
MQLESCSQALLLLCLQTSLCPQQSCCTAATAVDPDAALTEGAAIGSATTEIATSATRMTRKVLMVSFIA